mgnify:CR=1 FL=1
MNSVGPIVEARKSERRETVGNSEDGSVNFFLIMVAS